MRLRFMSGLPTHLVKELNADTVARLPFTRVTVFLEYWLAQWCAKGVGTSMGNPELVWHHARLIKEGESGDLSMDTMHLKDPLVLFGSKASALTLPLFLLSPRIIMVCHCSSTMAKDNDKRPFHCMALSGLCVPMCL